MLIRYRRGYVERLDEYLAMFVLTWISFSPILIFQALLSSRDENQIHHGNAHPSATEVGTPLLFVFGWMTVASIIGAVKYRTSYQVSGSYIVKCCRFILIPHICNL